MLLFLLIGPAGLSAQQQLRFAARQTAALTVQDGGLAAGTPVRVSVQAGEEADILLEGLIEGFLDAGLIVLDRQREDSASVNLMYVLRSLDADYLRISVVGSLLHEERFVVSREYAVPVADGSWLDDYLAPAIIVSAAALVVYLLLTVRSS